MEEYAYILDYIPAGFGAKGKESICYALGDDEFKLFELAPRADAQIMIDDRVYIGKDGNLRKDIDHVKRRIGYDELTGTAQKELEFVIRDIVLNNQKRFIRFYNEAESINIKKHLLEELPGVGKKTVTEILNARKEGAFKDFEDMKTRTSIKDPAEPITARILLEISDRSRRRYLFIVR